MSELVGGMRVRVSGLLLLSMLSSLLVSRMFKIVTAEQVIPGLVMHHGVCGVLLPLRLRLSHMWHVGSTAENAAAGRVRGM